MEPLTAACARALERCLASGGVAVLPTETVYGLACDPESPTAVKRLYALKGRPAAKPTAVMFFSLPRALAAIDGGPSLARALGRLLPAALTVLIPNPQRRFALACGPDPATLGLRVPALPEALAALGAVRTPVLQSSANLAGGAEARRLDDVPAGVRAGADLVLDGGELPGTASTVLDLRAWATTGRWKVLRPGPVGRDELARALATARAAGPNPS